jgi:hypothetical protein
LRQVCVALPTEVDQLLGPTPCAFGCWNTLRTLRGMSNLVRGLIVPILAILFSLRSARKQNRVDSSFVHAQGGIVDIVND